MTDPFALEVHHPVQPDGPQPSLPALPTYVAREHDPGLRRVVAAAAQGDSRVAVLVGGSSTGKTRACWEALHLLRDLDRPWRLWHPIDPARPEAALRELPSVGPRTVVWLNEAQFYLDAPGGLGERIAAGLREALRDPVRAPVLVLATLWPQHWDVLTVRPAAGDDPHAQARELLAGRDIAVPAAFTAGQLRQLAMAADPRLALAAEEAEDGHVIQFLAGAPELMGRYRHAPPAAAALVNAAIDARRLGMGVAVSLAFLEQAAPGYLPDADWDGFGENWLDQALAYTTVPARGIRGPLTRIRARPSDPVELPRGPAYRLADYLEQYGRRIRRAHIPPAGFWDAAANYADPADLTALARAAQDRGLLRTAARLRKRAAMGNADEGAELVRLWHSVFTHAAEPRAAQWAVAHASLEDADCVAHLLDNLQEAGAEDQAAALLARDPAAHVSLDSPIGVAHLLDTLRKAGAIEQIITLLARDPAAHDRPDAWFMGIGLEYSIERARNIAGIAAPAACHSPRASFGGPETEAREAELQVRKDRDAAALAHRAADGSLDDPSVVANLLDTLREAGATEQTAILLARDPAAYVFLDDPLGVALLLDALRQAGAEQQITTLLGRDPAAHVQLNNSGSIARLINRVRKAGAEQQVIALAQRAAAHAPLNDPFDVAWLIEVMRHPGTERQVTVLVSRDPATRVSFDDAHGISRLLDTLREAGAEQQVATLLSRDPATHVSLNHNVAELLGALREAGAEEQAGILIDRLPPEGIFDLFREQADNQVRYRFGREPDGSPARSWGWDDLG